MALLSTKNIVPRGGSYERKERRSFRVGSTAVRMGYPVELNSSTGRLDIADGTGTSTPVIGVMDYMNDYVAKNETTLVTAGDPANVIMFGETFTGISGGTFNYGAFLKYDSSGQLVTETDPLVKTVATVGISIDKASASGQDIEYMPL